MFPKSLGKFVGHNITMIPVPVLGESVPPNIGFSSFKKFLWMTFPPSYGTEDFNKKSKPISVHYIYDEKSVFGLLPYGHFTYALIVFKFVSDIN